MLKGLVISLPYCYLNTEVQSVMLTHYRRWQLIRTVGTGRMSGDKYFYRIFNQFCSLSIILHRPRQHLSSTASTVNKIDLDQVSPDQNVFKWHNLSDVSESSSILTLLHNKCGDGTSLLVLTNTFPL